MRRIVNWQKKRIEYVIPEQELRKPQVWHITPEGIKWAARNRRR